MSTFSLISNHSYFFLSTNGKNSFIPFFSPNIVKKNLTAQTS